MISCRNRSHFLKSQSRKRKDKSRRFNFKESPPNRQGADFGCAHRMQMCALGGGTGTLRRLRSLRHSVLYLLSSSEERWRCDRRVGLGQVFDEERGGGADFGLYMYLATYSCSYWRNECVKSEKKGPIIAGMPTGSHKKRGTTFCGKLDGELPSLPVRSFKDPPPPPILSEIISSDLDETQESIFWCKKEADFRRSAEDWHPCIIENIGLRGGQ